METPILRQQHNHPHLYETYRDSQYHYRQLTPPFNTERDFRSKIYRAPDYYSQTSHPQTNFPPTPPAERPEKFSLPPISALLNLSSERKWESATSLAQPSRSPPQHNVAQYASRPAPIQSRSHHDRRRTSPYPMPARRSPPLRRCESDDNQPPPALPIQPPQSSASSPGPSSFNPATTEYQAKLPPTPTQHVLSPPMTAPLPSSSGWSSVNGPRHSHHNSVSSQASASIPRSSLGDISNPISSANSSGLPSPSSPSAVSNSAVTAPANATLPDRYICPSCNKAFSRPSSLRIHVHSHTGEKPFRCPHEGCGKAFSVRSNMKRHQRGCHITGGIPPQSYDKIDGDDGARIVLPAVG